VILKHTNFSVHLGGGTGMRKSALARVLWKCFAETTGVECPLSAKWGETPARLQFYAYVVGDSILAIDDLKFKEHRRDAEMFFHDQANGVARGRMSNDGVTPQKALDPVGGVISTGESTIQSGSSLARVLGFDLLPGDIDDAVLSGLQADADAGSYRLVMAGYVKWLAPRRGEVLDWHDRRTAEIRGEIERTPGDHDRHPDIAAQLLAALELFLLRFAVGSGLIDRPTAEDVVATVRGHLFDLCIEQARAQEEARTGRKFLGYVQEDIASYHAHLAPTVGSTPEPVPPSACGWRREIVMVDGQQTSIWRAPVNSKKVGYVDAENKLVYLLPALAEEHAIRVAKIRDDPTDFVNVGRHLLAEGLVEPEVERRGEKTIRRSQQNKRISTEGRPKRYYVITFDKFFGPDLELLPETASLYEVMEDFRANLAAVPTVPTDNGGSGNSGSAP
jgi:hypothetical protein